FPGIIDDPGCFAGKLISYKPARGPDDSKRKSLQIFESLTANFFIAPAYATKPLVSDVASTRFSANLTGSFNNAANFSVHSCAYPLGAFRPVPIAVAPILISRN